jgi:EmrB/QacA subfamily drug resistance transporter
MPPERVGRQHYGLTFAVLALGGMAFALLQSLVAPALPAIQEDLHTSTTAVTWVLTAYLLSASVTTPILGRFGDMFGKERMLVIVLAVLGAGTLVSALASSITILIVGRVIQGIGGAVFPLAFGIIRDEFPRARVPSGIALISAVLGVGAGLGIVLAGPIVEHLSYHWLFWIPLIVVIVAAIASYLFVPESPVKSPGRIGWAGGALLSAWLLSLLLGVSQAATWGWGSPKVLGLFALAAILAVLWVFVESRSAAPLVDMRMMRLPGVWTVNATALLLGVGLYSSFVLIPQLVEMPEEAGFGFGASVTAAGIYLLPSTAAMLVVSPLAGRLSLRVGSKVSLVVGCVLATTAFLLLAVAHAKPAEIYLASAVLGMGIGFAFAAMANLIVEAVPPDQTGVATGMNTIARTVGGAVGSEISASVIAGTVTAAGFPTEAGFTAAFVLSAGAMVAGLLAALAVPARRPVALLDREMAAGRAGD